MLTVIVLPTAMRDVEETLRWIEARSRSGAESWHGAYLDSLTRLHAMADTFAEAPESTADLRIREVTFGTRRGRTFRLLFTMSGATGSSSTFGIRHNLNFPRRPLSHQMPRITEREVLAMSR